MRIYERNTMETFILIISHTNNEKVGTLSFVELFIEVMFK